MDFDNTEIAFKSRSDSALKRAKWLFRLVQHPTVVGIGAKAAKVLLAAHAPIEGIIRNTIFRQFCGGETIEECEEVTRELARFGIGAILDYAIEGNQDESSLDEVAKEILRTIERAKGDKKYPFCVFKVSGIARFDEQGKIDDRAKHRIRALCLNAHNHKVRLFIDAEESWYQDTIDEQALAMMREFNREAPLIYNTVQMYRRDRIEYLRSVLETARKEKFFVGLKIVRGAYMEKERARAEAHRVPSPILPDKASTDRHYDEALRVCLADLDWLAVCAGTHNEASTRLLTDLMDARQLRRNDERIFFSQLLGMSDHLSYNLAANGYNVAKYVPYGPVRAMLPYLTRRAEENTAVLGQTSRELSLILQELQRRRQAT